MGKIIKFPEQNRIYSDHIERKLYKQFENFNPGNHDSDHQNAYNPEKFSFVSALGYCCGMFVAGLMVPVFLVIGLVLIAIFFR